MKTRKRLLLWIVAFLAVAALFWIAFQPAEPTYKGRRLSQWLGTVHRVYEYGSEDEAREAIRQMGTNALPHLVRLLGARDPAWKVALHGLVGKQSMLNWQPRMAAENRSVAYGTIAILGDIAAPAIPQISPFLTDPETAVEAVAALGAIGPAAVPTLMAALTNRETQARANIPHILASVAGDTSARVPVLLGCLGDADPDVRCAAVRAFGGMRADPETVVPALLPLLSDADLRVRRNAADTLARIRSHSAVVVPALLPLLTDRDRLAKASAMRALAAFGKEAEAAVPTLLNELRDPSDFSTLYVASSALKRIAPQTALEASARNLQSRNPLSRMAAAHFLGGFGWRALNQVPALQQLENTDLSRQVRDAVQSALDQIDAAARLRERLSQFQLREDGVIRGRTDLRQIALLFAGHAFAEGGETILNELAGHKAKASFFLTGDFLANSNFTALVQRVVREGHHLGPHSDRLLLLCSRDESKRTLVSFDEFSRDTQANLAKIERFGILREKIRYFLPPHEHYNEELAAWTEESGMTLINYTPGTRANADDTGEADPDFVSSQAVFDSIVKKEREDPQGLNGFILLFHPGSGPGRADKFHRRFGELLGYLSGKGYEFVRLDELLEPKPKF